MKWTTPEDLEAQVARLWDRGRLLAAELEGESLFPLSLRLPRPDSRAMSEQFEEVRAWIRVLEEGSRARRGYGYNIEWTEVDHRQLGRNRVPSAAVVPTRDDALRLVGKQRHAARFAKLASATLDACPELRAWLAKKPLVVLEHADDWEKILTVIVSLREHPRPGVYLRQLDIPGVDTKFIEARKGLLTELLDLALPPSSVDGTVGRHFESRYGLLSKPALVRFRILDPHHRIGGLSDVATPAWQFADNPLPVRRVFITENEINGLAFPDMSDAAVIFGLGYGLDRLADVAWLREKALWYWGDIDTHGFAILDRLRAAFPGAQSVLMDRETLMDHRTLWVHEEARHPGPLARLTAAEHELFEDLRGDRLGERVRLEQERIGFGWVTRALGAVPG